MIHSSIKKLSLFLSSLFFIFFGTIQSTFSQSVSKSTEADQVLQVSFVPGVSSSDSYSSSNFSFNILGGYNGAFYGFEMGSLLNINRYDVSGVQLSGVANINQQHASGVLLGGVINYTGQFRKGVMASGSFNISRHEANGVLLAGGVNITEVQQGGLMIAGGMNYSDVARGVNISPVNIAGNHSGVQFGVFNISGSQTGTQIGIINVVGEESEGTSIGLLSFVKGGRNNVDVWSSETGFINGGYRIGTRQLYNVISIGYNPFHGDNLWQVGIGLGYHKQLDEKGNAFETDLMHYHVNHDGKWTTDISIHNQWRIHYMRSFSENLTLFTGPSLNMLLSDENLSASFIPYAIADHSSGSNRMHWWVGWSLGIELF